MLSKLTLLTVSTNADFWPDILLLAATDKLDVRDVEEQRFPEKVKPVVCEPNIVSWHSSTLSEFELNNTRPRETHASQDVTWR